jgi:hypothetical protein
VQPVAIAPVAIAAASTRARVGRDGMARSLSDPAADLMTG